MSFILVAEMDFVNKIDKEVQSLMSAPNAKIRELQIAIERRDLQEKGT